MEYDGAGKLLNGAKTYTITFAKGQVPPVKGFWSVTLYNEHHLFAPNALNRFSLGTKKQGTQIQRGRFADALCKRHIAGW